MRQGVITVRSGNKKVFGDFEKISFRGVWGIKLTIRNRNGKRKGSYSIIFIYKKAGCKRKK